MFVFSHFYDTDFPAHFWISLCSTETNAKETEKTLLEFPVHIYSELTDNAFASFQALISSLLKEKKIERDREKKTDEE